MDRGCESLAVLAWYALALALGHTGTLALWHGTGLCRTLSVFSPPLARTRTHSFLVCFFYFSAGSKSEIPICSGRQSIRLARRRWYGFIRSSWHSPQEGKVGLIGRKEAQSDSVDERSACYVD